MIFRKAPFNPFTPYERQISTELMQANENFQVLAQSFKDNDPTTFKVKYALYAEYADKAGHALEADYAVNATHAAKADYATRAGTADYALCCQGANTGSNTGTDTNNGIKINPTDVRYVNLYIQPTQPPAPDPTSVYTNAWYDTVYNTLQYYDKNSNSWIKVDWTDWVTKDSWYATGNLKIENNTLQITNDFISWHQVYPTVGQFINPMTTDDASDDGKVIYLTSGQFIGLLPNFDYNRQKVRVAFISPSIWSGKIAMDADANLKGWVGVYPSDVNIPDGSGQYSGNTTSIVYSDIPPSISNANYLPLGWFSGTPNGQNKVVFNLQIANNSISVSAKSSYTVAGTYYEDFIETTSTGSFPSVGYYFGSLCYQGFKMPFKYFYIGRG
jgi:hypothetical protein